MVEFNTATLYNGKFSLRLALAQNPSISNKNVIILLQVFTVYLTSPLRLVQFGMPSVVGGGGRVQHRTLYNGKFALWQKLRLHQLSSLMKNNGAETDFFSLPSVSNLLKN